MLLTVSAGLKSAVQLITVLLIFVFVLALTYLTTRWIANLQKGRVHSRNIEVLETYRLTANKFIQIVRLGNRYAAVAIAKDTVTMLMELSEDQIVISGDTAAPELSFRELLEKAKNLKKNQV